MKLKYKYPSYCCPYCGAFVGWIGRFMAWLCGTQVHGCDFSNIPSRADEIRGDAPK